MEFNVDMRSTPTVPVELAGTGQRFRAMIDTGAEMTVFNSTIAKDLGITTKSDGLGLTMVTPGGKASRTTEEAEANLTVTCTDGTPATMRFNGITSNLSMIDEYYKGQYEEDLSFLMIIGSDTLRKVNAVIDYEKQIVTFNDIPGQ